ncbi:hypothetical protein ACQP2F_09340 [Actinoplanes sp. CA-030573]|uniref:hypothetical protein n=1 Tax=Actinoplanes sp. CA-030573 TaxID=3239898 RepID=UPI003D943FA8
MPDSAREEAERLVAAIFAMASSDPSGTRDTVGAGLSALARTVAGAVDRLAAGPGRDQPGSDDQAAGRQGSGRSERGRGSWEQGRGSSERGRGSWEHARSRWATGSAECCVCPVCKAIAAVRDPSPEAAVRLAAGAGDIASGVASLMRGLSVFAGDRPKRAAKPAAPPAPSPDQAWSTATRAARPPTREATGSATREATGSATREATGSATPEATGSATHEAVTFGDAVAQSAFPTKPKNPPGAGTDPWAAASAASAAAAESERAAAAAKRAAAQAERRAAAKKAREAAAEAARRVAEAAALAEAAKATDGSAGAGASGGSAGAGASGGSAGTTASGGSAGAVAGGDVPARGGSAGGGETGATRGGGTRGRRTPQRFDVWAAATAEAGVGDVGGAATVDHDVPGAAASGERDGAAGDAAPGDGAA